MLFETVLEAKKGSEKAKLELVERFQPTIRANARKLNREDGKEEMTLAGNNQSLRASNYYICVVDKNLKGAVYHNLIPKQYVVDMAAGITRSRKVL